MTQAKPSKRWVAISLLAALVLIMTGGRWFYHGQKRAVRQTVAENLTAIARFKAERIADWRGERLADAAVLVEGKSFFAEGIARFINDSNGIDARRIRARFRSLQVHYHYDDILLVDSQGRVRLSTAEGVPGFPGYLDALSEAFRQGRPIFTELHTGKDKPAPHIGIVAPLFSQNGSAKPMGAVILICDASRFLYPLIQSWPTPSRTAETVLVQRQGDGVLFLNDLRHRPNTALKLRIPLTETDVPAVMAVMGREGVVEGTDYRGVPVVSVILPIADSPWFMVAKQDAMEIYDEWHFRSLLIMGMLAALLVGLGALGLVAWQRNQKWHYHALYVAEARLRASTERHSVILESIGDAVIATDDRGRVELLNPMAESLTGWSEAEARGHFLKEVFPIINEQTRAKVEDPVVRVLREGIVVGLANHTLLIARDGTERPIADSGAPIFNNQGEITGVVLVFRDQTAERAAETALQESEHRYRLLAENSLDAIWTMNLELEFTYINQAVFRMTGYRPEEWIGTRLQQHCDETNFARMSQAVIAEMDRGLQGEGVVFEAEMFRKNGESFWVEIHGKVIFDDNGQAVGLQGVSRDISERKRAETERERLQGQLSQAQKMESVGRLAGGVAHDFNNMLGVILGYAELAQAKVAGDDPLHADLVEIINAARRSADITRQLLAFARRQTVAPRVVDLNDTVEGMLRMLRRLIGEDIDLQWLPEGGLWPVKIDPAQMDQLLANLCVNARDAIDGVGKITIETENVHFDPRYCRDHLGFTAGDYVLLAVSDDGCGMDAETRNHLFEPFFTTKGAGQGTGLGLATVYGIVKQNNGFINVYSEPEAGTTFKIYLPRHSGQAAAEDPGAMADLPRGNGETVLIVEDETAILKLGQTLLENLGYRVLAAAGTAEALALAEAHAGRIHLLITDVVMPEMNGRQLADRLKITNPELKVLFMSGYTADIITDRGGLGDEVHFVQKPFSRQELAVKVAKALGQLEGR